MTSISEERKMYREPMKPAPCKDVCPAGVDVPRYLRFIVAGKYAEALAVIRESIPFPAVCGYVCPAPCEIKCRLAELAHAPESIRVLKRFVADHAYQEWIQNLKLSPATGKNVAVVGSGPAGLTTAYYLARLGHKTTVFEALPQPGGMMRFGIPAYRLPRKVLDAEIEDIKKAGVELKTGTKIESVDSLLGQGFDAVLLAVGANHGVRLGIDGEDSPGVNDALSFLHQVTSGKSPKMGKRVAVVGGGNSAVDAARTALRLGAKEVTIIYRRTRAEMRAYPGEIEEATREGVNIVFLATPSKIIAENSHLKMECLRTKPGRKDADGRHHPQPIKGSEFTMNLDTVIVAIGQEPEIPPKFSVPLSKGNTIQIAPDTTATAKAGVFAAGDCASGPGSVIEAIATGRQAAIAIDRYLDGRGVIEEKLAPPEDVITPVDTDYPILTATRDEIPLLSITDRLDGFPLVELPISPDTAIEEANRCLGCDLTIIAEANKCRACFICQLVCSLRFEGAFNPSKAAITILPVTKPDGDMDIQISFNDKCDCCGLCVRYCPYGALSRSKLADKTTAEKRDRRKRE
ncbi:FAD-dependent oxidoreductase [Chloroflexota bacterium]